MPAAPLLFAAALAFAPPATVPRGAVFEVEQVIQPAPPADPLRGLDAAVEFTAPDGRTARVGLFWDGGATFRARFAPDAVGRWTYRVVTAAGGPRVMEPPVAFECVPSDRPGPPRVSDDGRHFVRSTPDGGSEPWFFLADTAWNGALRSDPRDWGEYLNTRRSQGFTAIQFVSTQWRGGDGTLDERPIVVEDGRVTGVNVDKLRAMDARVAAIASRGLTPAPVLLWALGEEDPGRKWTEEDAILVARYLKARWGAYGCVWLLGGDGKYPDADRWDRVGRAVFPEGESDGGGFGRGPVTLHMGGRNWSAEGFAGEPWFDFVGYQSGHGASGRDLRWLTAGPPATWWKEHELPVVNLEPNYEGHPAYGTGEPHDARHVRRAAWWSLLGAPPAGVSYGHQAIWPWNPAAGPVEGHRGLNMTGPWSDGLRPEGAEDMGVLRAFFESGPWTELRPAPELIGEQREDPAEFFAAARTPDGAWAVIYAPVGGPLVPGDAAGSGAWVRFDPRTGERAPLVMDERGVFDLPAGRDWVIERRAE